MLFDGTERHTMTIQRLTSGIAIFAVAFGLVGCDGSPFSPAGSREWIIVVENKSDAFVRLMVAEDEVPIGDQVGTARPAMVAPHMAIEVTFTVPSGQGAWAIFVNPGPEDGPLILAGDVPAGASGRLPLTISVGPEGSPIVSVPDEPGWFGQ
jgi:hypothetical protein